MERPYETEADNVEMFVGVEVEQTPAYDHMTLFVVGFDYDPQDIIQRARAHNCTHIYFGANQSFFIESLKDWSQWEELIEPCLEAGLLCTLDLDHKYADGLLESPLIDYTNFIPQISVKLPYVKLYNYNTTVKIDDTGFGATNPGVWCHQLHDLLDRSKFTSWDKYTKDKPLPNLNKEQS